VYNDLLDDEAHAGEALLPGAVLPLSLGVYLVHAVDEADQVVDGRLGGPTAHLFEEPANRRNEKPGIVGMNNIIRQVTEKKDSRN
jgi:hypothetical protein